MTTRRSIITGALALCATPPLGAIAQSLDATALGLVPDSDEDQAAVLAEALASAREQGRALYLPAGRFRLGVVELPKGSALIGVPGRTRLESASEQATILRAESAPGIRLEGLRFIGANAPAQAAETDGLVAFERCEDFQIVDCDFKKSPVHGLSLWKCAGVVRDSRFRRNTRAGIYASDSAGLTIEGNEISDSGNLGIYVEREEQGDDFTIIRANRIARIGSSAGGDGQNGNGINIFRADGVIVSGNTVSDCAFSAVRLNQTANAVVSANSCLRCAEVAVFVEFGFSGVAVTGNVIDGAAGGITFTNLDEGGRLASCSGNVVRNIADHSETNPDTTPFGISAEAEVTINGNTVENVPGPGIALGWGEFGRDLAATGNVLKDCDIGIAVSVVEGVGPVMVHDNLISGARLALVGTQWDQLSEPDLTAQAAAHEWLSVKGNKRVP